MVELTSLQQILSMSSGPEKVQQVHQQQPDTQGRFFAAEFREVADIQKTKVHESEKGNESHLVEDRKESLKDQRKREKGKKLGVSASVKNPEIEKKLDEVAQGRIVDIKI